MKTQSSEIPSLFPWRLRKRLAEIDKTSDSRATKSETRAYPAVLGKEGHPVGWIERTLLAVNTGRAFIDVADPEMREELVVAYETEGRDVIATSNSRTLLAFMAQLPVPKDFGDDIVVVEDDFPGTHAIELHHQLRARGWPIPVFTVSTRPPSGIVGVAS
jgi:hypothetical protein